MIEKTLTIPESILKAENMSYDNSNSGLNATDTQAAIDEINSKSDIKVFTESPMTNTNDGVVKFNEIGGVHKQFTTTGAQLWNGKYVTNALDKEQDDFVVDSTKAGNIYLPVTVGKQYTLSINGVLTSMRYCFLDADSNRITELTNASTTVATPEDAVYMTWRATNYHAETDIIMLNEGDVALPYEPYTGGIASPNPNYPQEIKKTVVTGVKTHGKNFIKNTDLYLFNNNRYVRGDYLTIKPSTEFTLSLSVPTTDGIVNEYDANQNNVASYSFKASSKSITFTTTGSTSSFTFYAYVSSDGSVSVEDAKVQLEEGTVATDYEPYQESTIEFSKPITLYGDPDAAVQDILNTKQVERKYVETIFDGSIDEVWSASSMVAKRYAYSGLGGMGAKAYQAPLCTQAKGTIKSTETTLLNMCSIDGNYTFFINTDFATLDEWKAHLASKPMEVVYELAEETTEPLPEVDQAALTQLKTYEGVTYVEFISDIQPTFKAESGTTQEGSYVLDLLARTTTVEKQIEVIDETLLNAQEDILDIEEAFHIPETTDTVLDGSYPGLLKVNEIGGKMEQFSTTGVQLFDKDNLTTGNILDDGSFGTSTSWGYQLISVVPNESYTISGSVGNSGGYFAYYDESKNVVSVIGSSDNMTVTVPDNVTCLGVSVILSTDADTLMVNAGTEPLPYEPYTGGIASPNPSYPQEIKCVKGKNLLDCNLIEDSLLLAEDGLTYVALRNNGNFPSISVSGTLFTGVGTKSIAISNLSIPISDDYILSGCVGGSESTYYLAMEYEINGVVGTLINTNGDTPFPKGVTRVNSVSIVVKETSEKISTNFYPMIRHASVADPTYVPYGLLRVKTHGKNFWNNELIHKSLTYITPIKTGESFTFSYDYSGEENVDRYGLYIFDNMGISSIDSIGGEHHLQNTSLIYATSVSRNELSITAEHDGYVYFRQVSPGNYANVSNIQAEFSSVATDYEPYTESSYTFSEPIDLYGTDDAQDVITAKEIGRKFVHVVYDGDENWKVSSSLVGRYFLDNVHCKHYGSVLCTQAMGVAAAIAIVNQCYISTTNNINGRFLINTEFATVDEWKTHLQSNPMSVTFELEEPTTEPLPLVDQIGLNNLLTYNDVTYVEFDCDGPQPTFKAEYPTSKENGYVIESLSDSLTVNGHTVESNVPADAEFTDTVYDDSELRAKITSVENQIDGFLSLDSTVVVKTDKFKTGNDNRIETTVIPAGANIAASTYYDGKIYSTDGTRLYVSDLTASTQYIMTIQGQAAQITGIAVCCDTTGSICIHVVDSQGRASCASYDDSIAAGSSIDFATRMTDVTAIYQYDNAIYLMDSGYRLHTADSSGMNYNNIGMVTGSLNLQTISWIKVFGDTLVVGGTDQMSNKMCELYDLNTGNQIEVMVSEEETVTLADVCYYEGGLIGVCTENGYFYRAECGKFYNPLVSTNSEASPMLWREFSMDVDTSYGVAMYVEGSYLVIYNTQACYLFNSDGDNYYANTNTLVNVFSRDEGIYFVCQNDATVALYETKEISLAEAIMKIKA